MSEKELMKCPFCHEVVDAIVEGNPTWRCPECKKAAWIWEWKVYDRGKWTELGKVTA